MRFTILFALFVTLAIAAPTVSISTLFQSINRIVYSNYVQPKQHIARDDDDEKSGPLGIGSDDGLLGTKLLNDDGINIVSDGKLLGIGNDDGLLNSGLLATEDDDDDQG